MAQAAQDQDIQDQMSQAQQAAWAQMTAQKQLSLHPMATAGSLPPPPTLPIPSIAAAKKSNSKGTATSMNKLSLFAVSLTLMLSGALTFLSGVLLGVWFAGPSASPVMYTNQTGAPAAGLAAPQGEHQANSAPQQVNPSTYATAMGVATGGIIASAPTPDVPTFLQPLMKATQNAVGQQIGSKVESSISHAHVPSPYSHQKTLPSQQSAPPSGAPPSSPPQSSMPISQKEASSAPSQSNSAPSAKTGNEDYTVQLGAYAAKDNAVALVNYLQGLSLPSQVVEGKSSEGGSLYYVHSGLYKDYNMALEAATQFASNTIPGAIVAKISQQK
ncbi:MAG: SPOR domain-containing protein [Alphaproteobacteria bacterium]|nr:SPOR domain-containing protein [Alphaproteobacteria bacterium]